MSPRGVEGGGETQNLREERRSGSYYSTTESAACTQLRNVPYSHGELGRSRYRDIEEHVGR